MVEQAIVMTRLDVVRIRKLLEKQINELNVNECLKFQEKLNRAKIVDPMEIPGGTVTMNSRVVYEDVDSGESHEVTVVYPANVDDEDHRISVLSPIGSLLIGSSEGQVAERHEDSGAPLKIRLLKVLFQPEASGHFLL